jgi:hypothetical protein
MRSFSRQHRLYFLPLPHGHGSLRPPFIPSAVAVEAPAAARARIRPLSPGAVLRRPPLFHPPSVGRRLRLSPGCRVTVNSRGSAVHALSHPVWVLRSGPEPMSAPRTASMPAPRTAPPPSARGAVRADGRSHVRARTPVRCRTSAVTPFGADQPLTRPHVRTCGADCATLARGGRSPRARISMRCRSRVEAPVAPALCTFPLRPLRRRPATLFEPFALSM